MFLPRCYRYLARSRHFTVLAAAVWLGLVAMRPALAQTSRDDYPRSSPKVMAAFREVVAEPSYSTVRVLTDGKEVALGAVVGSDGWILTKASELKGKPVCKLRDGTDLEAKVVGVDDKSDLAMLKVEAKNLKPVIWGQSSSAVPGNWVAVPGTSSDPIAIGVVSVAARKPKLLDMPFSKDSGFLGVQMEQIEGGVKITLVVSKSPADKAGVKVNDVILAVEDKIITDIETMQDTIARHKAGETITVRVKRDEKEMEMKATLEKRQGDGRADFQNSLGGKLSERRGAFPMVLQHDTILKPSECGGPLVDLDGKTVGINIARAGRVETYALPAETVVALLPDLKSGKLAPKFESEEVKKARAGLKKAEADLADAQKKAEAAKKSVDDARKALEKAEADDKNKEGK
jgi:serine protease Do